MSELIETDALLRESEERFRLMADYAPVMLWKTNVVGDCDFFNQRWLEFTGRPLERELGVGWAEGVHPEDFQHCMDTFLNAFVSRQSFRMEYRLRRIDGAFRVLLDHGVPRFAADGAFEGYMGSCVDVTDMREAADKISDLNAELHERVSEREVLLRELHHRVKNNLQLVSSMLSLQGRLLRGEMRDLIEEGITRVHAIALVHEKLCESDSMVEVDMVDYARDLVSIVRRAIATSSSVATHVSGDVVKLGADQAVPCGLIINELVTNACKHAFPGDRPGNVFVEVRRLHDQVLGLVVRDDGVGFPAGAQLVRDDSVGLDLVVTLARQLEATLAVKHEMGTSFELTIPVARRHP